MGILGLGFRVSDYKDQVATLGAAMNMTSLQLMKVFQCITCLWSCREGRHGKEMETTTIMLGIVSRLLQGHFHPFIPTLTPKVC